MVSFNKFEAIKIATHCYNLSPCKFSPISFIYQTRTGDSVKEFGRYLQRKPVCLGTSYFKRKQTHSFWWNCIYTYHVSTFWSLKSPSDGWLTAMMRTWLLFIAIYDVLVCLSWFALASKWSLLYSSLIVQGIFINFYGSFKYWRDLELRLRQTTNVRFKLRISIEINR